jgi:hypothetical protein
MRLRECPLGQKRLHATFSLGHHAEFSIRGQMSKRFSGRFRSTKEKSLNFSTSLCLEALELLRRFNTLSHSQNAQGIPKAGDRTHDCKAIGRIS